MSFRRKPKPKRRGRCQILVSGDNEVIDEYDLATLVSYLPLKSHRYLTLYCDLNSSLGRRAYVWGKYSNIKTYDLESGILQKPKNGLKLIAAGKNEFHIRNKLKNNPKILQQPWNVFMIPRKVLRKNTKMCVWCGAGIMLNANQQHHTMRSFCSHKCFANFDRSVRAHGCRICGKVIKTQANETFQSRRKNYYYICQSIYCKKKHIQFLKSKGRYIPPRMTGPGLDGGWFHKKFFKSREHFAIYLYLKYKTGIEVFKNNRAFNYQTAKAMQTYVPIYVDSAGIYYVYAKRSQHMISYKKIIQSIKNTGHQAILITLPDARKMKRWCVQRFDVKKITDIYERRCRLIYKYVCDFCHKEYETVRRKPDGRKGFCSQKCRTTYSGYVKLAEYKKS